MRRRQKEEEDDPENPATKGIYILRLERKLAPVLDAWRKAKLEDPEAWGGKK